MVNHITIWFIFELSMIEPDTCMSQSPSSSSLSGNWLYSSPFGYSEFESPGGATHPIDTDIDSKSSDQSRGQRPCAFWSTPYCTEMDSCTLTDAGKCTPLLITVLGVTVGVTLSIEWDNCPGSS